MKKSPLLYLVTTVYLLGLVFAVPKTLAGPANFITTWRTTSPSESITIPTSGSGYNYDVDWGDSSTSSAQSGDASHTYASPGIHTISISGAFPRIYFADSGDHPQLISIEQWGSNVWTSMDHAFWGATNLVVNATDIPDLSSVTSTAFMFHGTTALTSIPNINSWNVSGVTDMHNMFSISNFNSPIGSWNVSAVTNMDQMFYGNEAFNQNIGTWDVSHVTNMHQLFYGAASFNQNLNIWDVSSVTNMTGAFGYAVQFNQNLGAWDISHVTNLTDMFTNTYLSDSNYDNILKGWALLPLQSHVVFDAVGIHYCGAFSQRDYLTSHFSWTITDAGETAATCHFTETPTLVSPSTSSTHDSSSPMLVSFLLPETPLSNSIVLTFTPTVGSAIVFHLRDATPTVTNSFSLPITGGYTSTVEVVSASAASIPDGIYTVTLSYQDTNANTLATATANNVTIYTPTGTLLFHIFTDANGDGTQNSGEFNNFPDATLTIAKGSESEEVHFDSHGDINSSIAIGTYTLTINLPSGYTVTGGSNHFPVTITASTTTDAGHRGIGISHASSSSGGSGGSSSGVSIGGGSSSSSNSSSSGWIWCDDRG